MAFLKDKTLQRTTYRGAFKEVRLLEHNKQYFEGSQGFYMKHFIAKFIALCSLQS